MQNSQAFHYPMKELCRDLYRARTRLPQNYNPVFSTQAAVTATPGSIKDHSSRDTSGTFIC